MSILVIYERGKDRNGPRDQLLRNQIWGRSRDSKPINWVVHCCSDLTAKSLQGFEDSAFDFVIVLEGEQLTDKLLKLALKKLWRSQGRVIAVYADAAGAIKAPAHVSANGQCIRAYSGNGTDSTRAISIMNLRTWLVQNN